MHEFMPKRATDASDAANHPTGDSLADVRMRFVDAVTAARAGGQSMALVRAELDSFVRALQTLDLSRAMVEYAVIQAVRSSDHFALGAAAPCSTGDQLVDTVRGWIREFDRPVRPRGAGSPPT